MAYFFGNKQISMINILQINALLKNKTSIMSNDGLNKVVQNYTFYYFDTKLDFNENDNIYQKIKESKVLIIGLCAEKKSNFNHFYFIIGFKNTIICIKDSIITLLHSYFSSNDSLTIYFLTNAKELFDHHIKIDYNEIKSSAVFEDEISQFNQYLDLKQSNFN